MTSTTQRTSTVAPARPTSLAEYRARATARHASGPALPDVAALHAFFAASAGSDAEGRRLHAVVASVLARSGRVEVADGREWRRLVSILDRHRANTNARLNCAVLSNLVGIAYFGDADDVVALLDLVEEYGGLRIASVQHRAARFVEPDATYPLTTRAVRRMVEASRHRPARPALGAAVALLLEGIDPGSALPVIRTAGELVGLVDSGSVLEWRHHLAMIASSPWSPYACHIGDLAEEAGRPLVGAVVEQFTELCREQHKEREREQVAEEVRRLIASSGVNQKQFARWVGTSPSRLSTYVSGAVTPSASLMLRMTRTSRLLQERDGGAEGENGPGEHPPEVLARDRSHLSAV